MIDDTTTGAGPEDEALDDNAYSIETDASGQSVGPPPSESELGAQLAAEKDRSLRLQAELQNVLARTARELAAERRYSGLELARDMLPALDNVDRAIQAAQKSPDPATLLEGFRMVRQQLAGVLERHGCKPIEAQGQPFDPTMHEAILQQPSDDTPAGNVVLVAQGGYVLHDRVVRPAQVIVSSGRPA